MNKKTRNLTLSALFTALAVVILYIASIWPTGQIGLTAAASLFIAATIIELGLLAGISVYIVCSVLAMLILPDRFAPLMFILFFGHYPILKFLIEKILSKAVQIIFKLLTFNLSLTIFILILGLLGNWLFGSYFQRVMQVIQDFDLSIALIYITGSVIFIFYDYGFSKLILFYIERITKAVNKNNFKNGSING